MGNTWQIKFNADKCFTIRITNSRSPIRVDYKIHDQHLNLVPYSKYLGVSLYQTLSWKTHINNVTAKAYRTLGFLRRNMTGCTKIVKDRTYKALIRPQLEYASPVIYHPNLILSSAELQDMFVATSTLEHLVVLLTCFVHWSGSRYKLAGNVPD